MIVTGASVGPKEKSVSATGGKREFDSGAEVGSAKTVEQLIADVGVSIIMGSWTITVGVEFVSVADAQALRIRIIVVAKNNISRFRFIRVSYWFWGLLRRQEQVRSSQRHLLVIYRFL